VNPQAREATDAKVQDQKNVILFFSDIRHFIHLKYVLERASINQISYVDL
jgi:hypothetical protein